jgi:hypothetical protein
MTCHLKMDLKDCSSNLKNIINKASNIVRFVSELLEEENRLQSANATRWNSQLHMPKSILKVPEQKLTYFTSNLDFHSLLY